MEPVPVLLSAGAVVAYTAHRAEKLYERLRGHATLPGMLSSSQVDDATSLTVLAVHLREITLPTRLAGQSLRVCTKLGEAGDSARCESHELQAPPAEGSPGQTHWALPRSAVHVGQCCLFLGALERPTALRFRLLGGKGDLVLAKGELPIVPALDLQVEREVELLLNSGGKARLKVTVEVRVMKKGTLCRSMQLLGAEKQENAILMDTNTLKEGELDRLSLRGAADGDHASPLLQGVPLRQTTPLFAAARMSIFHMRGTRRLAAGARSVTRRLP